MTNEQTSSKTSVNSLSAPTGAQHRGRTPSPGPPSVRMPSPRPAAPPPAPSGERRPSQLSVMPAAPPAQRARTPDPQRTKDKDEEDAGAPRARIVLQQIESAKYSSDDKQNEVGPGYILYVSFMKKCDVPTVQKMAAAVLDCNNIENEAEEPRVSLRNAKAAELNVCVIPQASLGGKLKRSAMQFHALLPKADAKELYAKFVYELAKGAAELDKTVAVHSSAWGARQGLQISSSGPNTMCLEF
eukprot:Selendium_serpulae@DN4645_c0_g1_i1.p2